MFSEGGFGQASRVESAEDPESQTQNVSGDLYRRSPPGPSLVAGNR